MENQIKLTRIFTMICIALTGIGAIAMVYGLITSPQRAWASFLLSNFYFFLLGIGATFFLTLQYITRSGWSAGFKRIPEAMMMYVPVAGIIMILLYFGMEYLYPWSQEQIINEHEIIAHKASYLNIPFFFIRLVLFFLIWTLLIRLIRKASLKEDETGGLENFNRMEKYSRIFIFFLAISFSLLGFDLLMSIETEWFSTIFALKNFIAAFQHSTVVIFIILIVLNRKGYFSFLNISHIHDFARYIFIVSIFYGYFWFSQYMLIWYGNIPEETIYYAKRWTEEWKLFWWLDITFNWIVPFLILLPVATSRNKWIIMAVGIILLIGQWIDLYVAIFPGSVGISTLGFIEIGTFLGFCGLFTLTVALSLAKASLVPLKHPLIEESYHHHFESYI